MNLKDRVKLLENRIELQQDFEHLRRLILSLQEEVAAIKEFLGVTVKGGKYCSKNE